MDESVLEYGVLRVPAAIACMLAHASCNNLGYTLTQCESQSLRQAGSPAAAASICSQRMAVQGHPPTTRPCSAATREQLGRTWR